VCIFRKKILDENEIEECKKYFIDGRYNKTNFEIAVDIEHFDSTLKTSNPWLWDNLFVVLSVINQKAKRKGEEDMMKKYGGKGVNDILKPDLETYNPFELLCYDWKKHEFNPNDKTLENNTYEIVLDMIKVLGLNFGSVKRDRKEYLETSIEQYKSKKLTKPTQFFTAFEMSLNYFKELELQ